MDLEQSRQLPVVILRPQMSLVLHSNQLGRDAHMCPLPPHAALKHIVHAQFPPNLRDRFIRLFVRHGRSPSDYPHLTRRHLSQSHDGFFTQTIAEIVLSWIAAQILEWKNGKHDPRPFCLDLHGLDFRSNDCMALETIPFPEHSLDILRVSGVGAYGVADLSDRGVEAVVRVEVEVRAPKALNKFLAADQPSLFPH